MGLMYGLLTPEGPDLADVTPPLTPVKWFSFFFKFYYLFIYFYHMNIKFARY